MNAAEKKETQNSVLAAKGDILRLCRRAGSVGAHLGGCLSLAEILTVLYTRHLRFDPENPLWDARGRFVLSKGHGGIAQYAAMHQAGILTDAEMAKSVLGEDTVLYKHPQRNPLRGIEFSGGSLGQGLAFAVGEAMAVRQKGFFARVYALVGDGELNEGSIWEALAVAGHQELSNLTVIVDVNGLQLDGFTKDVQRADDLAARFSAFGFAVLSVDGHDVSALDEAFLFTSARPTAILAKTKKGHGVSFAEDNADWHSRVLTDAEYAIACRELGVDA